MGKKVELVPKKKMKLWKSLAGCHLEPRVVIRRLPATTKSMLSVMNLVSTYDHVFSFHLLSNLMKSFFFFCMLFVYYDCLCFFLLQNF